MPDLSWFYFICLLSATVLWKDYNGTLEESLNNFEKKIGLYTYVDTTEDIDTEVPFYIPPIEAEVDSSFILPDSLSLKQKRNSPNILPPIRDNNSTPDSNLVNNNLAFDSLYHPYPIDDTEYTKYYKQNIVG